MRPIACVVAGGEEVEPERVGPLEQTPELHRPVALDARVRRAPGRVRVDVGLDDGVVELVGEVEHVVRDAELGGDAPGVLDVGDAAAPGVGLAAPELERDAGDVVALLEQQRGRDRRVDPAAHRDEHARASRPRSPPRRRGGAGRRRSGIDRRARRRRRRRSTRSPRLRRIDDSASSRPMPMAASTCDGSVAPDEHDEPAAAHTPGLVERDEQRLGLDAAEPEVRVARDLGRRVAVLERVRDRGAQAVDQPVAQSRRCARRRRRAPRASPAAPRPSRPRRRRSTCRNADRLPARRLRSAARARRRRARPARRCPWDRRTCAPRSPPDRRCGRRATDVEPRDGLHRVGVHQRARRAVAHPGDDLVERLDRADLVVDEHHRHEHGARRRARRRGRRGRRRRSPATRPSRPGSPRPPGDRTTRARPCARTRW